MPRIRLLTIFIAIAIISVWMATGTLRSDTGHELRRSIVFLITVAVPVSGIAFRRGASQAFWIGAMVPVVASFIPSGRGDGRNLILNTQDVERLISFGGEWAYLAYDALGLLYMALVCSACGVIFLLMYKSGRVERSVSQSKGSETL
jgi:hypothetical protein